MDIYNKTIKRSRAYVHAYTRVYTRIYAYMSLFIYYMIYAMMEGFGALCVHVCCSLHRHTD